VGGVGGRGAKL